MRHHLPASKSKDPRRKHNIEKVVEDGVAYDVPSGHLTVHTASAFCQRAPPVKTMHSGEMQSNFLEKGKGKSKQSEQSNKLALPWMK